MLRTTAHIIVAITTGGTMMDFIANTGATLLGWSHANGSCSNQKMKNARRPEDVIPADAGRSIDYQDNRVNRDREPTISDIGPLGTKYASKGYS